MYYPKEQKEPSGCLQTLIITRVIFGILAVPLAIIGGVLFTIGMTFYLFTVSAPLALIPLGLGVVAVYGLARWERKRIEKEMRRDDDRY
ncbi:MAG TPA: hypothetical protein VFD32_05240 [Dehalococcoidia bacterium]|nr:hypothetical protein [Dehalococcoidia bacterium]